MRVAEKSRTAFAALLALTLVLSVAVTGGANVRVAYAETDNIEAEITDEQRRVEETAAAYNDAVARVEELDEQISDNEDRIAEIERELPECRDLAADAVRELYLMQRDGTGLIELLLGSESLDDFLMRFEYLSRVYDSNADALATLKSLETELEQTQEELNAAREEATQERDAAEAALAEAQEAREQAQREAQERAAAQAAQNAATSEGASSAGESEDGSDASQDAAEESGTETGGTETITPPAGDGVDWSSDKESFVASWGARIDAYLAGSPLSGYGSTFAAAAWDYGIDPRFSPAISAVESSKGAYCFNPHNAWGWGSASWGSWEEAIYAHVAGLARGYGYTVTIEGAQKYCPPNWQHWYNSVSANMDMI